MPMRATSDIRVDIREANWERNCETRATRAANPSRCRATTAFARCSTVNTSNWNRSR